MSDEKRLDRIEDKVDKVLEHQVACNATLAAQHESLKAHMKRTEILESIVIPMNRERYMVKGAIKLLGVVLALCACTEGIVALLEYLRK